MKKISLLLASLIWGVVMFGCGGEKTEVSPEQMKLDSAEFTVEGLQKMVTSPEVLTPVEYRALILAYSKVGINKENLELDDNPVDEAIREVFRNYEKPQTEIKILKGIMTSKHPQVRAYAICNLLPREVDTVMDVLNGEKEAYVIKQALLSLKYCLSHDNVVDFIVKCASHENKAVRKQCAYVIADKNIKDKPGVKDAVIKLLQDQDADVKGMMCRECGDMYDDSYVPELVKILDDPSQADIHSYCMESLYTLWYDFPYHRNTSESAYNATMNYFKKTPRTKDVPAWQSTSKLEVCNESNIGEWKSKATYFNAKDYIAVMSEIACDADANWLGRTGAVRVIGKIGSKSDLQSVKGKISANSADGNASLVLKEVDKLLK